MTVFFNKPSHYEQVIDLLPSKHSTMFTQHNQQNVASPLKASIQDLARLHQFYDPSDEMLWAFFNARVLMNQPIEVDDFVLQIVLSDEPYGQIPTTAVG